MVPQAREDVEEELVREGADGVVTSVGGHRSIGIG
jgi:hypothetical protein